MEQSPCKTRPQKLPRVLRNHLASKPSCNNELPYITVEATTTCHDGMMQLASYQMTTRSYLPCNPWTLNDIPLSLKNDCCHFRLSQKAVCSASVPTRLVNGQVPKDSAETTCTKE
jgi:hypothetical protein